MPALNFDPPIACPQYPVLCCRPPPPPSPACPPTANATSAPANCSWSTLDIAALSQQEVMDLQVCVGEGGKVGVCGGEASGGRLRVWVGQGG